jgi:hypothetical protein
MPGAVSTGAYTAGVMDFLIEAMDAWYQERASQERRYGDRYNRWTIPPHELNLAVLAGASGGGMVASITAAALSRRFHPVHDQSPAPTAVQNALFRSWVTDLDPKRLLGTTGLNKNGGEVVPLLDAAIISEIAARAIRVDDPLPERRQWVRDGLRVVVMRNGGDQQVFEVNWKRPTSEDGSVHLDARGGSEWQALAQTAAAAGIFPLTLAAQMLAKLARKPGWDAADGASSRMWNIDGTANSKSYDCARRELTALLPVTPGGKDALHPETEDRAIIHIAPLQPKAIAKLPRFPDERLTSLVGEFVEALAKQLGGGEPGSGADSSAANRWVISPAAGGGEEPLACGLLGGFSGFLSQLFREHDYQLGRRNCQRFLTNHFGLPWTHPICRQYGLSARSQSRLDAEYGFDAGRAEKRGSRQRLFPLIPVQPQLRQEIQVVRKAADQGPLAELVDRSLDRMKSIARALLQDHNSRRVSDFAFLTAWPLMRVKLREPLLNHVISELAGQGLVQSGEPDLLAALQRLRSEITLLRSGIA